MHNTIFWDFDGTLVHSKNLWSISIFDALKKEMPGYQGTMEDIRTVSSGRVCTWDTQDVDYSKIPGMKWWEEMEKRFKKVYLKLQIPENVAEMAAKRVQGEITDLNRYQLYEDTVEVLEESKKRGINNFLISNNYPELEQIMKGLGILKYFDGLVVSAVVGIDKPDPAIFRKALEMAGNPQNCWMVGDNPIADMKGAKQMGMHTALVHRDIVCKDAEVISETLTGLLQYI